MVSNEISTQANVSFWKTKHAQFDGIAPIDHLFNRLDGLYPGKWRSLFTTDSSITNWRNAWSESIYVEKLTLQELKNGIKRCNQLYEWPPSFNQFLKACRPEIDYEAAFYEAVEQNIKRVDGKDRWTSAVIFWSASRMCHELKNYPYQTIKGMWKKTIDNVIDDIKTGILPDIVPEKKAELPSPGKTSISPEEAKRRLDDVKKILSKKVINEHNTV